MEEKVSGIVLGGISYGENDKILKLFTLEKGLISAKIKGVKKAGAKLKFASEPFCFAEYIIRNGKAGYTVINASLFDSFYPIREDIFKYYAGATVLEFIKKFYLENQVSPEIFLSCVSALKSMAYSEDYASALVKFLIFALKDGGYALETHGCFDCRKEFSERMFFDYNSGAFYCSECYKGEGREINPQTFLALQKAENGGALTIEEGVKALRLLDYYLDNKVGEQIKSLKELLKMLA